MRHPPPLLDISDRTPGFSLALKSERHAASCCLLLLLTGPSQLLWFDAAVPVRSLHLPSRPTASHSRPLSCRCRRGFVLLSSQLPLSSNTVPNNTPLPSFNSQVNFTNWIYTDIYFTLFWTLTCNHVPPRFEIEEPTEGGCGHVRYWFSDITGRWPGSTTASKTIIFLEFGRILFYKFIRTPSPTEATAKRGRSPQQ